MGKKKENTLKSEIYTPRISELLSILVLNQRYKFKITRNDNVVFLKIFFRVLFRRGCRNGFHK